MNNTTSPEDMASFEVLHTQNHSSGSFQSGEYSFLPEVSSDTVKNGDSSQHMNDSYDLRNMQSALAAAIMTDSSVEVHSQLLGLIEENKSLEDKLNKNNAMMKEQMSTISSWRQHMLSSKEKQEQSLQKAMEKVSALEKENTELREKIDSMVKTAKETPLQNCTKCTIFENGLNNLLAIDCMDGESFLLELSDFREYLLPNLTTICRHVEALSNTGLNEEERRLLKTFVLIMKFKIAALEVGNLKATVQTDEETGYEVVHQKYQESLPQLRQDIEDLQKVIKAKDSEVGSLKEERESLLEKIKTYEQKLQEWELALKSQYELMSNKLEIQTSISEKYKERCENLQQHIDEYAVKLDRTQVKVSDDHLVKELREEVKTLQDILKLEQSDNQKAKEKLAEVMMKCEKLQVDHDRVTKLFEIQSKDLKEKNEELVTSKDDVAKEYIEKLDQLTAQLFEMEEQLRESNSDIRKLQEQLAKAKEEEESIPILKAQIDFYKKDFENVEAAKNAAAEEVERLTNELKKYEKRCDACPCSCNKSPASAVKGYRSGRFFSEQKDQSNEEAVCPFCQETFKNERAAHHHINRCHDDDGNQ